MNRRSSAYDQKINAKIEVTPTNFEDICQFKSMDDCYEKMKTERNNMVSKCTVLLKSIFKVRLISDANIVLAQQNKSLQNRVHELEKEVVLLYLDNKCNTYV